MTIENHPVPITAGAAEALIQGSFKTLADVAQFNSKAYVKRSIFNTESLQFGLYCLEPGQVNPLHKHPHSSEICYFVQGTGEVIIGKATAAVQPGVCVHDPETVFHELKTQGQSRCW